MCKHPIQLGYNTVPCGQCKECRIRYATSWAVRCVLESQKYKENVFLTLTFNDEHLPFSRSLDKKTLQKFLKRFRKQVYPVKIRFFASGEYGKHEGKRPHYHLLIFGIGVKNPVFENLRWDYKHQGFWCDCKAWKDERGDSIGNCFIGTVTIQSAYYVAKYSVKKLTGQLGKEYYEQRGVIPEFSLSSRRPGIGLGYLESQQDTILKKNYIGINGSKYPIPRYFHKKLKETLSFYELYLSGQSFEQALKDREEWFKLYDELDDPYTYLRDRNIQRDRNLQKKEEIMKGVL